MTRETPADRLRLAMQMQREGTEMMRRKLRRQNPDASEKQIADLLHAWLGAREPDAPGSVVPWPRIR